MILVCKNCGRILPLKRKELWLVKCQCGEQLVFDGEIFLEKVKILEKKPVAPRVPQELLFNPQTRDLYFKKKYEKKELRKNGLE